jgi:hypothetical protein
MVESAIDTVKRVSPDVIYTGSLIKVSRAVNPSTNTVVENDTIEPVEIIQDVIKADEIDGLTVLRTDFKLHIIARNGINVDFYDELIIKNNVTGDKRLKIKLKTDIAVGIRSLMFTIIAG